MRNITLSVDDEVLRAARRYASARDATVNGLVREFLGDIARREDRVREARDRLRELSRRSTARLGRRRWSRDALHDR